MKLEEVDFDDDDVIRGDDLIKYLLVRVSSLIRLGNRPMVLALAGSNF